MERDDMRYDMSAEYAGRLSLITEHCAEFLSEEEVEQVLHGTAGALFFPPEREARLRANKRGRGGGGACGREKQASPFPSQRLRSDLPSGREHRCTHAGYLGS